MHHGYVTQHRPQHHFPGNDKNLNKNKRIQIRYQAFIKSVRVCVCVTIPSDCDSCSHYPDKLYTLVSDHSASYYMDSQGYACLSRFEYI